MSTKTWPNKDPNEVLDYGIDWSQRLSPTEVIISSAWTVPGGLVSSTESFGANSTTIWLSGGTEGATYTLVNRVGTDEGRVYDQSVKIKVKSR